MIKKLLLPVFLLVASSAYGQTVRGYVDNGLVQFTCTNYNTVTRVCSGGSQRAWNSLQGALANVDLNAGQILRVRSGTYVEAIIDHASYGNHGSLASPIIIEGHPGDSRPIIKPSNNQTSAPLWIIFGRQQNSSAEKHLILRGLEIDGNDIGATHGNACLFIDAPYVTIDNTIIKNCSRDGVSMFHHHTVIQNSQILNCGKNTNNFLDPPDADTKGFAAYSAPFAQGAPDGQSDHGQKFINNIVDGCRGGGIVINYGQKNTIVANNIFRNMGLASPWPEPSQPWRTTCAGISAGGNQFDGIGPQGTKIYNNLLVNGEGDIADSYDCKAFQTWGTRDTFFYNNTVINFDSGIHLNFNPFGHNLNVQYFNNFFDVAAVSSIFDDPVNWPNDTGSTHTIEFRNNIIPNGKTATAKTTGGITFTVSNNTTFTNLAAVFTDPGANDFTLKTGSVAINAGRDTSALLTTDRYGNSRVVPFDVGDHEFNGTVVQNDPPVVTITIPTTGPTITTSSNSINLAGTCTDVDGTCAKVTWANNRGGSGTATGTSSWTVNNIPLGLGSNVLTVSGTDDDGAAHTDVLTVTYNPGTPTPALVASWSFSEGSGGTTADKSGNGNTGTISGATWSTLGKYGNALSFDGTNDVVNVADASSLDLTHGVTMSAWVQPKSVPSAFMGVISKNYLQYLYATVSGYCGNAGTFAGIQVEAMTSANACHVTPLVANIWTHVGMTYDGKTLTLYKNGVSVASTTATGLMVPGTGNLTIGATQFGEFCDCFIDEVRVYNYAISPGQMLLDMNTPIDGLAGPAPPRTFTFGGGSGPFTFQGTVTFGVEQGGTP